GITPYLAQRKMQAKIFKEMQLDMVDPLDHAYYSQTPYRYGPKLAVKYKVSPPEDRKPLPKDLLCNFKNDENRLREALQAHLAWGPAVFNFYVQLQTDPASMPIEDAI